MTTKICNKCKQKKELTEFHKDSRNQDKLSYCCKPCKNVHHPIDETMTEKECKACKIIKPVKDFEKNSLNSGGYRAKCKICQKDKVPILKEDITKKTCKNCTELKSLSEFYPYHNNCKTCYNDKRNEYSKDYNKRNKDVINSRRRLNYHNDELNKLKYCLHSRIKSGFKYFSKNKKAQEILGCSMEEFKRHIESQFINWMTWSNYGNTCETLEYNCSWDLDHIIPVTSAESENHMYLLNHWSNFQPLCSKINRNEKRDTIPILTNLELKITTI